MDLESPGTGSTDFKPATFHTSVGRCQGHLRQAACAAEDSPTATRLGRDSDESTPEEAAADGEQDASYMLHSCWTYWGHSGAPLFDAASGNVIGLHCAWDDESGIRWAQKLSTARAVLSKAEAEASSARAFRSSRSPGTEERGRACASPRKRKRRAT